MVIPDSHVSSNVRIKYSIDAGHIRALKSSPLFRGAVCEYQVVEDRYFDTSDHALRKNGFLLRVRDCDNQISQRTVYQSSALDKPHIKSSHKWRVENISPDCEPLLTASSFNFPNVRDQDLKTMFKISYTREILSHVEKTSRIKVILDTGNIFISSTETPINELELILDAGVEYDRFMLAGWLEENYKVEAIKDSKAERGYQFLDALTNNAST